MDDALVDAFLHQHNMGNRVNGTFTKHAYDNIVIDLKEQFGRDIEKEKVKNHWKTLKTKFSKCYDLFKKGMSGFSWNPVTKLWGAEREAHPHTQEWMTKPIPNYDKMVILYGNDRATGKNAETAAEMRQRRQSFGTDDELRENVADIDNLVFQNEVTLENHDALSDECIDNMTSPQDSSWNPF
ncbi:hypothetical protein REPUB_Repub13aG0037400 [Reevesia pubescens]